MLADSLLNRKKFSAVLLTLTILSILVNFAAQWHAAHLVDFSSESAQVSWAILHGRGFADPFLTGPSGPTAHVAPLYPYFFALLCAVFGTGAAGWAAVLVVTSAAWALQWAYAYRFAAVYGQASAGLIVAVIGTLLPLQGRLFKWEAVFTGAALAYSAWAMSQVLAGIRLNVASIRLGVGLSLAVLICPSSILIWPAWAILAAVRLGISRAIRIQIPALILILLPVSLWTVRNWVAFGHLFFIRDSLGLEMNIAYNDCSTPLLSRNISTGCFAKQHPSANSELLQKVREIGEFEFSRQDLARARSWVASHPARSLKLTLAHIAYFWFPLEMSDKGVLVYGVLMSVLTLLSFAGILWVPEATAILWLLMLPFSAIYCFAQFEQRYRYPILWASAILAAAGLQLICQRWRGFPDTEGASRATPAPVESVPSSPEQ